MWVRIPPTVPKTSTANYLYVIVKWLRRQSEKLKLWVRFPLTLLVSCFLEEFYMLYTIFQIGCILVGSFILFPLLIDSLSKLIWLAMGGNEDDFKY